MGGGIDPRAHITRPEATLHSQRGVREGRRGAHPPSATWIPLGLRNPAEVVSLPSHTPHTLRFPPQSLFLAQVEPWLCVTAQFPSTHQTQPSQ